MSNLADEYVEWLREDMQRRPETVRAARWRLNMFSRTFDSRGVHEITTADISRWLKKNRWEPLNRKHYLAVVHAFFEYARKQKLVSVNPATDVDQPEVQAQPPEVMTPPQVRKLFRKAEKLQPSLIPTFALSFFCGLRPSEIAGLDWKDVDLTEGFVRVIPTVAKMKRQRLVDLSPNAKAWLAAPRVERGRIQDFSQSAYRRRLAKVLEAAELTLPYNAGRLAFASYHVALNSPEETAKQMGHSRTDFVVTTYRGLVTKKAARSYWSIPPMARRKVIPLPKTA